MELVVFVGLFILIYFLIKTLVVKNIQKVNASLAEKTGGNLDVTVDVRTNEERKFVGYVEDTIHIPWATGTALNRNPRFAKELENKVGKDKIILLLCRSGKRSAAAANVAFNAGFENIYNIEQGFEGDLDENNHRGAFNGWRFHDLPWKQE